MRKSTTLGLCLLLSAAALSQNSPKADQIAEEVAITKAVVNQLFTKRSSEKAWLSEEEAGVAYYPGFGFLIQAPRLVEQPSMYYAGDGKVTIGGKVYPAPNIDSLVAIRSKKVTELTHQYFTNYAKLLTALQPGEKIKLLYDHWIVNPSYVRPMAATGAANKGLSNFKGMTAEVKQETLQLYASGTLSKDAFVKKISVAPNPKAEVDQTDLSILSSIVSNLINKELGSPMVNQVKFNHIPGFGVVFEASLTRYPMFRWRGDAGRMMQVVPPIPAVSGIYAEYGQNQIHITNAGTDVIVQSGGTSAPPEAPAPAKPTKKIKMNRKEASMEACIEQELVNQEEELEEALNQTNRALEKASSAIDQLNTFEIKDTLDLMNITKQIRLPMLKYAATLSTVKDDELILLKISAGFRKEATLRVPMSVVRRFERKELSEQQALDAIALTE